MPWDIESHFACRCDLCALLRSFEKMCAASWQLNRINGAGRVGCNVDHVAPEHDI